MKHVSREHAGRKSHELAVESLFVVLVFVFTIAKGKKWDRGGIENPNAISIINFVPGFLLPLLY